jgi:hypothetical protein
LKIKVLKNSTNSHHSHQTNLIALLTMAFSSSSSSDDIPEFRWGCSYQDNFDSLARTDHLADDEAESSGLTSSPPPSPQPRSIGPAIEGTMAPTQEEPATAKKADPLPAEEEDDDPLDDLSDAFQLLNHSHRDMIATTAFNYYGDRFVTGSVDGKIKVYNKNNAGNWVLCDTWGAHNAEVFEVHLPVLKIHLRS